MESKIIYLVQELDARHQEALHQLAPNYEFRTQENPPTMSELPFVEIMLGWDPEIGKESIAMDPSQ